MKTKSPRMCWLGATRNKTIIVREINSIRIPPRRSRRLRICTRGNSTNGAKRMFINFLKAVRKGKKVSLKRKKRRVTKIHCRIPISPSRYPRWLSWD